MNQFMNINVPKITRASRLNRLHLLPADTVEHAFRGALFQYAQMAELATHTRYLHALQRTRGFTLQGLEDFGGGQPLRSLRPFAHHERLVERFCQRGLAVEGAVMFFNLSLLLFGEEGRLTRRQLCHDLCIELVVVYRLATNRRLHHLAEEAARTRRVGQEFRHV